VADWAPPAETAPPFVVCGSTSQRRRRRGQRWPKTHAALIARLHATETSDRAPTAELPTRTMPSSLYASPVRQAATLFAETALVRSVAALGQALMAMARVAAPRTRCRALSGWLTAMTLYSPWLICCRVFVTEVQVGWLWVTGSSSPWPRWVTGAQLGCQTAEGSGGWADGLARPPLAGRCARWRRWPGRGRR